MGAKGMHLSGRGGGMVISRGSCGYGRELEYVNCSSSCDSTQQFGGKSQSTKYLPLHLFGSRNSIVVLELLIKP